MIRRLTLIDFMAHARTVLELAPGLNVLCGPNNTGKSAVVEALRCLANNPFPRHCIRHGASEARVEALLDTGWRVAWIRRKTHALYELSAPGVAEPQVFAKLGRGVVPPEVARALKLSPVAFEKGDEVDVHLGDQRHPIFLLDKPGSLLADFLASSTESAHLMAMQDLLREKARRAKGEQRRLEEATGRAAAGLDRLAGLPAVSLTLESLRENIRFWGEKAARMPELENRLERLRDLSGQIRRFSARAGLLAGLALPPPPAPAAGLADTLARLGALGARAASIRAVLERLAPLHAPASPRSAEPLRETVDRAGRLLALKGTTERRLAALSALRQPPETVDPAPLAELLASMETLSGRVAKGRSWLAERTRELAVLRGRIAKRLEEAGECPLCGAGLDAARFLKEAGGHGPA